MLLLRLSQGISSGSTMPPLHPKYFSGIVSVV